MDSLLTETKRKLSRVVLLTPLDQKSGAPLRCISRIRPQLAESGRGSW